jgi:branched-chain amino acid transport system substrate-binding protein
MRIMKIFKSSTIVAVAITGFAALGVTVMSARAADPVVFGFVMPFSGWFQPIDAGTIKGAKLAIDEINAAGGIMGHPISTAEFDNKSDPPLGADGAVEVISKGAKAILFPSDFDFGAPGAFIAQQKDVISFSGASDPKFGVTGIGNLAYSMSNASQSQGALLAEWGYNKKGWKTAYVLLDNTISYTKSLCASFVTRWQELAGKDGLIGQDTFLNGDPTITAQVTKLASLPKKPDVIAFCSFAPGGPSALRQLRAAGVNQPIISGESMDGDFWIGTVPNLSDFYVVNYGSVYGDDPDPAVNKFFDSFKAKYGQRADVSYAIRGYSVIQAYAIAATKAGSFDGPKVAEALDSFHDQPLAIGPTTFSKDLHSQIVRPMTIIEATDGKFHAVGSFSAEAADIKLLP